MWGEGKAHTAGSAGEDNSDLLWVPQGAPQGASMMPVGYQGATGMQGAAPTLHRGSAIVTGLQPAAGHAPVLQGLPQLNGALQQALQSLPMPGADASGGGGGSATTAEAVDKQAVVREKNRLAQRRFRWAVSQAGGLLDASVRS